MLRLQDAREQRFGTFLLLLTKRYSGPWQKAVVEAPRLDRPRNNPTIIPKWQLDERADLPLFVPADHIELRWYGFRAHQRYDSSNPFSHSASSIFCSSKKRNPKKDAPHTLDSAAGHAFRGQLERLPAAQASTGHPWPVAPSRRTRQRRV